VPWDWSPPKHIFAIVNSRVGDILILIKPFVYIGIIIISNLQL